MLPLSSWQIADHQQAMCWAAAAAAAAAGLMPVLVHCNEGKELRASEQQCSSASVCVCEFDLMEMSSQWIYVRLFIKVTNNTKYSKFIKLNCIF